MPAFNTPSNPVLILLMIYVFTAQCIDYTIKNPRRILIAALIIACMTWVAFNYRICKKE
nr:hypothetical protein K-LCC10_0460 [Kaumoebavirus]